MLAKEQVERMVRDACAAEEMYADRPLVGDMACHVKALAFDIETLENRLAHQAKTFDADAAHCRRAYDQEIARLEAVQEDVTQAAIRQQDRIRLLEKACEDGLAFVKHALEFFGWGAFPRLREEVEALRGKLEAALKPE